MRELRFSTTRDCFGVRRSAAFVAAVLVISGCGKPEAGPRDDSMAAIPTVSVVHPQRKSLQRIVEQPGTIQAYEHTQLAARVPGYVRLPYDGNGRLLVDIGRKVRGPRYDSSGKEIAPGEILAELVVPELEQETKQKEALVRQALADVEQSSKALAAASAGYRGQGIRRGGGTGELRALGIGVEADE